MAGLFQAPKGVPDYFPPRSISFLKVQETIGKTASLAGYGYVAITPTSHFPSPLDIPRCPRGSRLSWLCSHYSPRSFRPCLVIV